MRQKIIFSSIILIIFAANIFAQKRDSPTIVVKTFYRFHLSHEDIFNDRQITLRKPFLTPKLRQLFDAELQRQKIYAKKYPTDKPYFDGLSFEPIEFCKKDYSVENAVINQQTATVQINFVYGKSSCAANDGTKIFYKISLQKIGKKWLIDNVTYDDGSTLTDAFNEAKNLR